MTDKRRLGVKRLGTRGPKPGYGGRPKKPIADDESFADRTIQAQLDHAMGVENDDYDWLVEPFE